MSSPARSIKCPASHGRNARRCHPGDGSRPGDDFNRRVHWSEILEPHGWRRVFGRGDEDFWRRPGKTEGSSATTNYQGSNLFYCFTSSTEFDPETSYSKLAVYAILEHGGDFSAAARDLAHRGYGRRLILTTGQTLLCRTEPCQLRTREVSCA